MIKHSSRHEPEQGKLPGLEDANKFLERMKRTYHKEYHPGKLPLWGIDAVLLDTGTGAKEMIIQFRYRRS